MSRLFRTGIQVSVVLRNEVHVVEYETLVVVLFECLDEADVHQFGPVELASSGLMRGTNAQTPSDQTLPLAYHQLVTDY